MSEGMLMMVYFWISKGPSSTIKCNWKQGVVNCESRSLQYESNWNIISTPSALTTYIQCKKNIGKEIMMYKVNNYLKCIKVGCSAVIKINIKIKETMFFALKNIVFMKIGVLKMTKHKNEFFSKLRGGYGILSRVEIKNVLNWNSMNYSSFCFVLQNRLHSGTQTCTKVITHKQYNKHT